MSEPWRNRVEAILADPQKAEVAAILYCLVMAAVNSPVTCNRRRAEELLLEEAVMIQGR